MRDIFILNDISEVSQLQNLKGNDNIVIATLFNKSGYVDKKLDILNLLINNSENLSGKIKKIKLNVENERIPNHVFKKLLKLYEKYNKTTEIELAVSHALFSEMYYTKIIDWDIETIMRANLEINRVCDFIKKSNFSQMEALAYIHRYVSTVAKYNFSRASNHNWSDKDQFFAGAYMNLPEVVCAGYSSLMKEIIDNLNMPGLKCDMVTVGFEHIKKQYIANHARCYVTVKDTKYGINQSMFDDPTWDNKFKEENSRYTHFAMSNECHFDSNNENYHYTRPNYMQLNKDKSMKIMTHDDAEDWTYDRSKNKIDQHMIEKIYFNVLQKQYPFKSVDQIYNILAYMALDSYKEQNLRGFNGNLTQEELMLTKEEAEDIYKDNIELQAKMNDINEKSKLKDRKNRKMKIDESVL